MKNKIKEYFKKIKEKGFILKLSLIPFLSGLMYAIAGSDHTPKQVRRFGIPVLLTFVSWLFSKNIWVLTCLFSIFVFHIGHGIPSPVYQVGSSVPLYYNDKGSALGRFWYKIFKGNHRITDYFVRGCKAFLFALCFISIPVLKGNWVTYSVLSSILTVSVGSIAWRGLGEKKIKIGDKTYTVLFVDIVTGTLLGLFVMIIGKF